ncbi:hypothetical protein [Cupriavidus necator]
MPYDNLSAPRTGGDRSPAEQIERGGIDALPRIDAPTPAPSAAADPTQTSIPPATAADSPRKTAAPVRPVVARLIARPTSSIKPAFREEGNPQVIKQVQLRFREPLKLKLEFLCQHWLHTPMHAFLLSKIEAAVNEELAAYRGATGTWQD